MNLSGVLVESTVCHFLSGRLSYGGEKAARDIVQFVPYRNFREVSFQLMYVHVVKEFVSTPVCNLVHRMYSGTCM